VTAPIALPASQTQRRWTVRAGLWRARGGGVRVKVVDAGRAAVEDDAVEIGAFDAP
jgi:hypothetical protein